MVKVHNAGDLQRYVGRELGVSCWLEITQQMINMFADATGDHQWIHTDPERAKREMPGGKTIAHGYLILSLLPRLGPEIFQITGQSRSINYGCNKIRFINPAPVGSRIRLRQKLIKIDGIPGGNKLIVESVMELEGQARPVFIAETIRVSYD